MRAASCGCWAAAQKSSGLGSETVPAFKEEQSLQRHRDVLAAAVVRLPRTCLAEQVANSSGVICFLPLAYYIVVIWDF
jgi:hypothetical protein